MNRNRNELTWSQTAWRFLGIILAVLGASLVPGDSVNGNVLGTVVLMVLIAIPAGIIAWYSEVRRPG